MAKKSAKTIDVPTPAGVTAPTGKRIVLFSDGTGNSAAAVFKTNVRRTYEALDISQPDQIAYYDDGVGSSSFKPLAAIGGATGFGLARNVRAIYAFLCRHYSPGDEIFIFGFSRGAFTARILVGLIESQGVIPRSRFEKGDAELDALVAWAYRNYRRKYKMLFGLGNVIRWARDQFLRGWQRRSRPDSVDLLQGNHQPYMSDKEPGTVGIAFLGLWDTVDAYGLPIDELTQGWSEWVWPLMMRDQKLWKGVRRACHALGLDDERNTFHPRLFDEAGEGKAASNISQERISQVWFTGMHADVGGGYPNDGLSYVTLDWMVAQARAAGLAFRKDAVREIGQRADSLGYLNNSRKGLGGYYRYQPRKLSLLPGTQGVTNNGFKIHHSVFDRIKNMHGAYAPISIPGDYSVVDSDGNIAAPNGTTYGVETPELAATREKVQERVWNWVWGRRVVYFTTLFFSLLLAAMPWMTPAVVSQSTLGTLTINDEAKCINSALCFAAGLPDLLGGFLPGFLKVWTDAFKSNPDLFTALVAIVVALTYLGANLETAIKDRMSLIWRHSSNAPKEKRTFVQWLRTSMGYRAIFKFLKYSLFPTVFGAIMALVLYVYVPYVAANRIAFSLRDAAGEFCVPRKGTRSNDLGKSSTVAGRFTTNSWCWATDRKILDGATYEVSITVQEEWKDNDLKAGPEGLRESPSAFVRLFDWATRRVVGVDYFVPIARVADATKTNVIGQDEYVLLPMIPSPEKSTERDFKARFTANSSGDLFLYVNDSIVQWPQEYYSNNEGSAILRVRRVITCPEKDLQMPQTEAVMNKDLDAGGETVCE